MEDASNMLREMLSISALGIALSMGICCFIFSARKLTPKHSISTYGKLIGFSTYNTHSGMSKNYYSEYKKGRLPVVVIKLDNELVDMSAMVTSSVLTTQDIGKNIKVKYRRNLGVALLIDDEEEIRKYNRAQNISIGVCAGLACISLLLGALVYFNWIVV